MIYGYRTFQCDHGDLADTLAKFKWDDESQHGMEVIAILEQAPRGRETFQFQIIVRGPNDFLYPED